jgi:hypothetical protein
MENPDILVDMCDMHGQRHRTNNGVGGWNSKLNTISGRKPPDVHLLVKISKE